MKVKTVFSTTKSSFNFAIQCLRALKELGPLYFINVSFQASRNIPKKTVNGISNRVFSFVIFEILAQNFVSDNSSNTMFDRTTVFLTIRC